MIGDEVSKTSPSLRDQVAVSHGNKEFCQTDLLGQQQSYNRTKDLWSIQCEKDTRHANFIQVKGLTIDSLPVQIRNDKTLEYIKLLSSLTVKIDISCVSASRPDYRLRTGSIYPHSDVKWKNNINRVGTGTVVKVTPKTEKENCYHEDVGECPSKTWELKVITSRHNVWNKEELKGMRLEISFFHNDQLIKDASFSTVITADDKSEYSVINADACALTFVTCNAHLGETLSRFCKEFWEMALRLKDILVPDSSSSTCCVTSDDDGEFLIIVSHPHGCQKCVSFGQVTNSLLYVTESSTSALYVLALHLSFSMRRRSDSDMCVAYTTVTCKGCSGALIVFHSKSSDTLKICTHEGYRKEDCLNHSGNPEYIQEECMGTPGKESVGLHNRRRYSKYIDEEEAKRFSNAKNLSFCQQIDYAYQRFDVEKLRNLVIERFGPDIEDQVSEWIREGNRVLDIELDRCPPHLKKQKGWHFFKFLSDKLSRLLQKYDKVNGAMENKDELEQTDRQITR